MTENAKIVSEKQDMSLYVSRHGDQLTLAMNWATALFTQASIEQFLQLVETLLANIAGRYFFVDGKWDDASSGLSND